MQIGFIGLGKMGGNMVRRLSRDGHQCHIYSIDAAERASLASETGAVAADSLAALVGAMSAPRTVWLMVPAGKITQGVVDELAGLLQSGDTIIDGGNSNYRDSVTRAAKLAQQGLHFLDCGTSGGLFGLERGYSLMIGGSDQGVERARPVFETLAPGVDAAPRTAVKAGGPLQPGEAGWLHCGKAGAGHYVKMVHNGIEYGIMQAFAEGFALFASAADPVVPEDRSYPFDLPAIAEVWRRGSVVSSWLLDLGADALAGGKGLADYSPRVADSGEGRWTLNAAIEQGVATPVIADALFARFTSHDDAGTANRFLSALRSKFGGHDGVPMKQG
ncbi:phosphogluconate dehydrogenase (NAD(+)-dependent, decarboxylating) [Novosphingobium sp.]|uniref:phosphogluconate dehydrogenase (NAD(+)-dependent, decarboxylating) n=1 Tax=Novosphingobium sp. TaxID=1874826 RepID=UPI0025CFD047|nr:decarboxylating 6-phosphogluconate dehydrogenase [Novosphingobium sp.]